MILYPKLTSRINKGFALSWSYIIQCFFRLNNRKNHETIESGSPIIPNLVTIFAKNFKDLNASDFSAENNVFASLSISYVDDQTPKIEVSDKNADLFFLKDNGAFYEWIKEEFGEVVFEDTRERVTEELKELIEVLK